jgi:hypothetical protein
MRKGSRIEEELRTIKLQRKRILERGEGRFEKVKTS